MARDILRIVEADQVTVVKELNDGVAVYLVKNSLNFNSPAPSGGLRRGGRGRWEGYQQLTDVRENGELSFSLIISWITHPNQPTALDHANDFCAAVSATLLGRMIEFRHRSASTSSFFDVRGAADYQPNLRLGLLEQKSAMVFDFKVPVGPLIRGTSIAMAASATTAFPAKVALPTAVQGKAPALADIEVDITGGVSPPVFAAIGWSRRIVGGTPPFGIIEGESINGGTFDGIASGDAGFRGGGYAWKDLGGGTSAVGYFLIEPFRMDPDEFSADVEIEVYAVLRVPPASYNLRAAISSCPIEGIEYGRRYGDMGARGRTIVAPLSTDQKRITRLGVIKEPTEVSQRWLTIDFFWDSGSYGYFAVDYLVLMPAKRSVAGPTGKVTDANYPRFMPTNALTTKRVLKHDGTGLISINNGYEVAYAGMGSRIELPPTDVDLMVLLSSMVPDDPTINNTGLVLSHSGTVRARTYPRNFSLKGSV